VVACVHSGSAQHAAGLLYRAEPLVLAALQAKKPLPDREITPAGALL
jgi:hypothetical protein